MMPRLEAEETLSSATAAALGSGALPRAEASRLMRDLDRRARGPGAGGGPPPPARPPPPPAQ
jgi:hypothetical protein